jgi:ADP-ribose pyrophosphatase
MKLISITKVHGGEYLNTYIIKYRNKAGKYKNYEVISRDPKLEAHVKDFGNNKPEGVGIIAFNKDRTKILLQKEFRLGCGEWIYNFPGGLIDNGETPVETAKRELREETGLEIAKVIEILPKAYTAASIGNEEDQTVICEATGEFSESTSYDEEIEANWYSKEQVKEILKTEPISSRTQAFLFMWVYKDEY